MTVELFVGNLSFTTWESALLCACARFGEVAACRIARDKLGKHRGYGFVTFATEAGARACLAELHELDGRQLKIEPATTDKPNGPEAQCPAPSTPPPTNSPPQAVPAANPKQWPVPPAPHQQLSTANAQKQPPHRPKQPQHAPPSSSSSIPHQPNPPFPTSTADVPQRSPPSPPVAAAQQPISSATSSSSSSQIVVENLSLKTSASRLRQSFSLFGPVVDCIVSPQTNRARAFITFKDRVSAQLAVSHSGQVELDNQPLHISYVAAGRRTLSSGNQKSIPAEVFVGNLNFETTLERLYTTFAVFGVITDCRIPKFDSGQPKGFGFVVFADVADAEEAIRNSIVLDGRTLKLELAVGNQRQWSTTPPESTTPPPATSATPPSPPCADIDVGLGELFTMLQQSSPPSSAVPSQSSIGPISRPVNQRQTRAGDLFPSHLPSAVGNTGEFNTVDDLPGAARTPSLVTSFPPFQPMSAQPKTDLSLEANLARVAQTLSSMLVGEAQGESGARLPLRQQEAKYFASGRPAPHHDRFHSLRPAV